MPVRGQTKPLGGGYVVNSSVHAPKRKVRSAQTFICGDHADEIQMWCCRSTPGVWHVVEVSRYWQQGGACYQAGDGSLDDFVNEHPVQEAPYRVHAAIRAAVGPAAEDSTNKKEHANSFLLSKPPRFRHKPYCSGQQQLFVRCVLSILNKSLQVPAQCSCNVNIQRL